MELSRKFLGILLSLGVLSIFNISVSAMEGNSEEKLKIDVENVDIEKRDIIKRVNMYGKIKFVLNVFKVFNLKVRENVLKEVCLKTLKDPIKIIKQILRDIHIDLYGRTYDLNFEGTVVEFFKNENELSFDYLIKSEKEIEKYLICRINGLKEEIKEVERKYECYIEGEKYEKISKSQFMSILNDLNSELKRFESFLKGIKKMDYSKAKG